MQQEQPAKQEQPTKQEAKVPSISVMAFDRHGHPQEVTVDQTIELGKMLHEAALTAHKSCAEHQKYDVFNTDGAPKSREDLAKVVIERQWHQIQQWLERDLGVRPLEWSLRYHERTKLHQENLDRLANMGVFVTKFEEGKGYLLEFRPPVTDKDEVSSESISITTTATTTASVDYNDSI